MRDLFFRVLIVDQKHTICKGIQAVLETFDQFHVIGFASNRIEAAKIALSKDPDLILMNTSLPHFDGLETASLLLEKEYLGNIILMNTEPSKIVELKQKHDSSIQTLEINFDKDIGQEILKLLVDS